MGVLYMLEFEQPLGNDKHQAKYYLGYTAKQLADRLREHATGQGACITAALVAKGIGFKCVLVIPNRTRTLERKLKNRKSHKRVLESYLKRGYTGYNS